MVSFACSRIGLTIFFICPGLADRFKLCGSVGLSLELFIVYQFERRWQMASPPHLCGEFATFSSASCKKAKKYRTVSFDHAVILPSAATEEISSCFG